MTCLECGADNTEATSVCLWCGAEVDGATLAEWVEARKFSTTHLRRGYDRAEVDAFADAIRDTFLEIGEPPLTPDAIRAKQFSTTRLMPGYDYEEVDTFLDEAEKRLAAQPSTRAPAAQQPSERVTALPASGLVAVGPPTRSLWVGILILLVLAFVLGIPLLTGWVPGLG